MAMSVNTSIEWCDSTLNLAMGCDGCELWNRKAGVAHCYAGTLTDRYGGRAGWPNTFEEPKLFIDRLDKALKWSDLTGKDRPDKTWLNGRPRMIFLDDMGDTFTESLPIDWLAPLLPRMAESPHVFMVLTKRANRMMEFSKQHPLPKNFWPGVTVTSEKTMNRVAGLLQVKGGSVRWVSAEPLLGPVDFSHLPLNHDTTVDPLRGIYRVEHPAGIDHPGGVEEHDGGPKIGLVIVGGESGPGARPFSIAGARLVRDQCKAAGVSYFLKQVGNKPYEAASDGPAVRSWGDARIQVNGEFVQIHLRDKKGGDLSEIPSDLAIREFPK